jgi:hypothetical protein
VRKTKAKKRKVESVVKWRMVGPSFCKQEDKRKIEEENWEGEVVLEKNKGLNKILH